MLRPPAAFLVESVQAEGGVWVHSAEWLQEVQRLARETGALFIIDDIQAACGRTGSYFSFDGMGLDPDIVTLAKGLGGFGTPIAMNLNKPEVDARWAPGAHTGTFRGQGLSFVAGTVALDYFTDDVLMTEVDAKGAVMAERLDAIAARHPDLGWQVRGKGMMQGLDVVDGAVAARAQAEAFANGLLDRAVRLRGARDQADPAADDPRGGPDRGPRDSRRRHHGRKRRRCVRCACATT